MTDNVQRTLGVVRGWNSEAEYLTRMSEVLSSTHLMSPKGEPGVFALFLPMVSVSTGQGRILSPSFLYNTLVSILFLHLPILLLFETGSLDVAH